MQSSQSEEPAQYYTVLYTKKAPNKKRKNKAFADGVLEVKGDSSCILYDEDGKHLSKSRVKGCRDMPGGAELTIGNWEIEVDSRMDEDKIKGGQCFMKTAAAPAEASSDTSVKQASTLFKPPGKTSAGQLAAASAPPPPAKTWLHDPEAEGALVLNAKQLASAGPGTCVAVVVDPYVCRNLRPHQREGVQFLYECVMGLREPNRFGSVLGDEMGLGKTLQVIALVWTLLKQGPQGRPVAKRAIVVTPSSLTKNWAAEAQKWLGSERLKVMVMQPGAEAQQQVIDFKHGAIWKMMVVSYETLRKFSDQLAGLCDLLVCDEGHRLKAAAGNKTIDALLALQCSRRILLTGTPVQNNLDEFYAMMSFVNPDMLGSLTVFKRIFAEPISRSRDRSATAEEKQLGHERSLELNRRVDSFVLRRTAELNARYLPPLTTLVVFCKASELQLKLYQAILRDKSVSRLLSSTDAGDGALSAITTLRKLCNHPDLLMGAGSSLDDEAVTPLAYLQALYPPDYTEHTAALSGKMACLELLLHEILRSTQDRVVVVSSSTAALDIIQGVCGQHDYTTVRIDGATDVTRRQDIVNNFNLYNAGQVCLLSTRAGGAGLNLIGANRLVLFDSDWNPAVDLQAMARVWRDGQQKPCVVYRLLTTGTIDEKIFQRQLMKGELADMMHDRAGGRGGKAGAAFTRAELRELFCLRHATACDTRDLMQNSSHARDWQDMRDTVKDAPLTAAIAAGLVTFVHETANQATKLQAAVRAKQAQEASAQQGSIPSSSKAASQLGHARDEADQAGAGDMEVEVPEESGDAGSPSGDNGAEAHLARSAPSDEDVNCLELE
ncbi:hypothetical protein WJX72_010957 [[Myrmecia] bisecta]|uniref:DNA repair and recombination protein RAD54B n=1 Tax=[Myrmecia] bisecta TaxID=41462 RepID=A0AAW1PKX4_9CHLO